MPPSIRSRGYLPHWEGAQATYFVTFRLADSLPQALLDRLRAERRAIENAKQANTIVPLDLVRLRALVRQAERCLDQGLGHCYMRDPRVAKIVTEAIQHFSDQRYRLLSWCVMPNHVHALLCPLAENKLESILHSWKSYSALQANRLLKRAGEFWQREYFDHLVRSEASLQKISRYILQNPKKAGLLNWPWAGTTL